MPDRKPLISGNWKMHHTHLDAIQVVQKLAFRLTGPDYDRVDVSVHPAFTALRSVQTVIQSDRIPLLLGAQNCHWEPKGAFTGEISAPMLAKLNVDFVIVGHSERREYFAESDEDVNRKVKAVLANEMTPIMCCGETLEEREAGSTEEKVVGRVRNGLAGVTAGEPGGLAGGPVSLAGDRIRADLGHRYRAHGDSRRCADGLWSHPRHRRRSLWR